MKTPQTTTGRTVRQSLTALFALILTISAHAAPPVNDNLEDFEVLAGTSGAVSRTNVEATKELDEPDHAQDAGGASVWFEWTAPGDGEVTFDTFGSNFDTLLAVYSGTDFTDFVEVASNDQAGGGSVAVVVFCD